MAAVSSALSSLFNALQGLPPIPTATVVILLLLLFLLTTAPKLMNALNERYVTRKITTEEGALKALRILHPAPPTDDPAGSTMPGAGRPPEPSP